MAARLTKNHQESVRKKIQAIRIIEELQRHFLGERQMSNTQIRAAEILLNKSISNAATDANLHLDGVVGFQWLK